MSDYIVEKKYRPGRPGWHLGVLNYRPGHEEDFLVDRKVPGEHFVRISDEGSEEGAKRQAEAYFNGTHRAPQAIDAWVSSWSGRS